MSNMNDLVLKLMKSNEYLETQVKDLRSEVQKLNTINCENKPESPLHDIQLEIETLKASMIRNEKDLSQFMQYNRRENIEIAGIPKNVSDSDLEGVVVDILGRIGVRNISSYDIAGCHRLKNRKTSSSNVIVRFVCRKRVYECFENVNNIKTAVPEFQNLQIFENLCPRYQKLFQRCEDLWAQNKIKQLWTYNGQIHIKKTTNNNERSKMILHDRDIDYHFPN